MTTQILINFINKFNKLNKSLDSFLTINYNSYLLSILKVCKQAKMIADFTILNITKKLCQISLFKTNIILQLQSCLNKCMTLKYKDIIDFYQKMSKSIHKQIVILSTDLGIMTDEQAFYKHLGGLFLFTINFYDAIT